MFSYSTTVWLLLCYCAIFINKATLYADLEAISFDLSETDVNKVVEKYNKELLCILNKHAPEKCKKENL